MPTVLLSLALVLTLIGCSGSPARLDSLEGRWGGVANAGPTPTKATVDFAQDSEGRLGARLSVPDERLLSKPLINVRYHSPDVHFDLKTSERVISFDGVRQGRVISGFMTGEARTPLRLEYAGSAPLTPYAQEEVRFSSGDVLLAGTLLLPNTQGRHPAVILIHGSSTPNRDDFRFYGDLFARHGIAALIYDKRDEGSGRDGVSRVDLRELASDALAAVAMLRTRGDINPQQIGLWGHSQGGWVAPIAAAQSTDVAFVISFSGPGMTYAEVNKFADATRLRHQGFSESEVREAARVLDMVDEYVRSGGDRQQLQMFLDIAWSKPWAAQTTLPRRVPSVDQIHTWLRWRNLDLDPVLYWKQVKVPVLVLFGELDDVVPVSASVSRIEEALRWSGNKDVTIKVYPKASHTIQPAPDFLPTMVDWLRLRVTI